MSNKNNQSRAVRGFKSGAHGIAVGTSLMLLVVALAVPAALTVLFFWPLFPVIALLPILMSDTVRPSPVAVNVLQMAVIPPSTLPAHVMA